MDWKIIGINYLGALGIFLAYFLSMLWGGYVLDKSGSIFRGKLILHCIILLVVFIGATLKASRDMEKGVKSMYAGVLTPSAVEVLFPSKNKLVTIEFGTDFKNKPGYIIKYKGGPLSACFPKMNPIWKALDNITVSKEGEKLKVSAVILSSDGKMVAEIENNEWKTARPPKSWDRNFTDDTLEVKDDKGNIVLQVRLLKDRVQICGIFYNPDGNGVQIVSGEGKYDDWVGMNPISPTNPPEFSLNPIFQYPSELHQGELVEKAQ